MRMDCNLSGLLDVCQRILNSQSIRNRLLAQCLRCHGMFMQTIKEHNPSHWSSNKRTPNAARGALNAFSTRLYYSSIPHQVTKTTSNSTVVSEMFNQELICTSFDRCAKFTISIVSSLTKHAIAIRNALKLKVQCCKTLIALAAGMQNKMSTANAQWTFLIRRNCHFLSCSV